MSEKILNQNLTILDVIKALVNGVEDDIAKALLNMVKQRIAGDYLQTAGIFNSKLECISAVNQPNDYGGPGTGYRVGGKRWEEIKAVRQTINPEDTKASQAWDGQSFHNLKLELYDRGSAFKGIKMEEVVIGISPCFR